MKIVFLWYMDHSEYTKDFYKKAKKGRYVFFIFKFKIKLNHSNEFVTRLLLLPFQTL